MTLEEAERDRSELCRLTPDRALETLDEAATWLRERGVVTIRPDCSLPSLHFAMHEEPYAPGKGGFAEWPKTRWWWGHALGRREGIHFVKLRRGKGVFLTDEAAALADPLARADLALADEGAHGEDARRLAGHLAAAGPSFTEEVREELGFDARTLRALRGRLEPRGVLVARNVLLEDSDRYAVELARWDQRFPEPAAGGAAQLAIAGLRAAVVAREAEARRWFTWPPPDEWADELVAAGAALRFGDQLAWAANPASGS
jgi:hypothetical protein